MKIAICDDDLVLNRKLHQFIFETYHDIDLRIDEYRSGEEFLQKISTSKLTYDLLLLDIEMDRVNGITVAKELKQLSPKTFVVFITSHDEFATVGYEVSAFRYLIKPINKNKLIEAIEECNHILVKGIMVIIPKGNEESNRYYFKKTKGIFDELKCKKFKNISMDILSMGMTNDYMTAIEEGSTLVRVGTGIFGERNYNV